VGTLKELEEFRLSDLEAEYDAVHRSILTGLLANVAQHENGNLYRATHSRTAMLFPGSGLFSKKAGGGEKGKKGPPAKREKVKMPEWIMAGEWMETNRLYARTVARVEVAWILELGKHLCKSSV